MPKKLTREEFIRRAREVHGDKYDYSKVEYKNSWTKVCIICPIHGEFWQRPNRHLQGDGCIDCAGKRKKTTEQFIAEARKVHGDFFDYSKVYYESALKKVCIICPIHGEFWQTPADHLHGYGCKYCGFERISEQKTKTTAQFIIEAKNRHGDRYDYTPSRYKGGKEEIEIICPIHGSFFQIASEHLQGKGCPECWEERRGKSILKPFAQFLIEARQIHGDKYEYIEDSYKNCNTKMIIICPEHGAFEQTPSAHINGQGCPKCGIEKARNKRQLTFDEIVRRGNEAHNNKYIYIPCKVNNIKDKITIICPKHGEFSQSIVNHIHNKAGCPHCAESKGENIVAQWLDEHNLEYQRQYRITPQQVLFGRNLFKIDFYLPHHNTFIEFHGRQHYKRIETWHTDEEFANQQDRDRRLREYCKQHKIRLIEIPYTKIKEIDKILTRKLLKSNKK